MKNLRPSHLVLPFLVIILGAVILTPLIEAGLSSAWNRTELSVTSVIHVVFFLMLTFYSYYNSKSVATMRKYGLNLLILLGIGLYWWAGKNSHDASMPTLAGLTLVVCIYILPALLFAEVIVKWLEKK